MPHDVLKIALDRIETGDVTYRISTDRDDGLTESIRCLGQLHPVRLVEVGGTHVILSGFRRIAACRELGRRNVDAWVYPAAGLSERRRCLAAIGDNCTQRPLNAVETAHAVELLCSRIVDPALLSESLCALKLPENPVWVDQQRRLAALPPAMHRLLLDGVVGTAMALELGSLAPADGAALGKVFGDLRLSLSRQRETLGLCRDLSRRNRCSIRLVLESPPLAAVLSAVDLDIAAKTHGLRRALKRMRYPGLSAAEADFHDNLKLLSLGEGIRLDPPLFFEGTAYKMTLSFTSVQELSRQLAELEEKVSSRLLGRILDPHAEPDPTGN